MHLTDVWNINTQTYLKSPIALWLPVPGLPTKPPPEIPEGNTSNSCSQAENRGRPWGSWPHDPPKQPWKPYWQMAAYTWVSWDAGCITLEHEGWEANSPSAAVDTPKQVLMNKQWLNVNAESQPRDAQYLNLFQTTHHQHLPSNIYYLPSNIYHLSKSANIYPKSINITSPIYQDLDLPLLARRTEADFLGKQWRTQREKGNQLQLHIDSHRQGGWVTTLHIGNGWVGPYNPGPMCSWDCFCGVDWLHIFWLLLWNWGIDIFEKLSTRIGDEKKHMWGKDFRELLHTVPAVGPVFFSVPKFLFCLVRFRSTIKGQGLMVWFHKNEAATQVCMGA